MLAMIQSDWDGFIYIYPILDLTLYKIWLSVVEAKPSKCKDHFPLPFIDQVLERVVASVEDGFRGFEGLVFRVGVGHWGGDFRVMILGVYGLGFKDFEFRFLSLGFHGLGILGFRGVGFIVLGFKFQVSGFMLGVGVGGLGFWVLGLELECGVGVGGFRVWDFGVLSLRVLGFELLVYDLGFTVYGVGFRS
ncbi:hypothetical protein CR513_21868, partial [Mucuna pruriens]